MTRSETTTIKSPESLRGRHLLAMLCCLLLTPFDGAPLLQAVLQISVAPTPDDDPSADDEDEMAKLSGQSVRVSLRPCRAFSTALSLKLVPPAPVASADAHPLPPLSGCEHAQRNGIGTPLRC